MAIQHLALPPHIEPPPRMQVATRHVGPVLAAMRRHVGYRFVIETDRHGETSAWLERAMLRMV